MRRRIVDNFIGFEERQRHKEAFDRQIESITSQLRDNFSQELAFLLDDDNISMFVGYSGYNDKPISEIVYSFTLSTNDYFKWIEVKDDFIPFLQRLDKKFDIMAYHNIFAPATDNYIIKLHKRDSMHQYLTLDDIVNDRDIPELISRIELLFKLKFEE